MTPFIGYQSGGNHLPGTGEIRDLLRDTALFVKTLSQSDKTDSVTVLRQNCHQLMSEFSAALKQRGATVDVREDALYAQCGLLDEAVLRALPTDEKSQWDTHPLQVERNGRHDAGERVFERLTLRMRETLPNVDLLEAYAAVLGLGFMGRYAREGADQRTSLIVALNAELKKLRPTAARGLVISRSSRRLRDRFYRLSPWAIAGLGCVAAALVYLVWTQALMLQLGHLAPIAPRMEI